MRTMTTTSPATAAINTMARIRGENVEMVSSYVVLALGCIFAGVLMLIACVLCVRELLDFSDDESSSSPSEQLPRAHIVTNRQSVMPRSSSQRPIVQIITITETACIRLVCVEFLQKLNLHPAYFEPKYDRCYCLKHFATNKQKTYRIGGYDYTIPYGYMRFGLKYSKPHADDEDIFHSWATSYYGTSQDQLEKILRNRFIPFPSDRLDDNEIFSPGHPDPDHCYTSPSIYYTSGLKVCEKYIFISQSNEIYDVQIILQCKQKPNTFQVTHGQSNLCPIIPADQIKWKSRTRSTIIPYGLMIHIVKQP